MSRRGALERRSTGKAAGPGFRVVAGRVLLALLGLTIIGFLVRSAGPHRVAETLWQARSWLPLIVALEFTLPTGDFLTLRVVLGARAKDVPTAAWVRSSALAYAMMIVLPAGRAAGEVARATLLSAHLGAARAASASTLLQASSVFAIGVMSAIEAVVVASRHGIRSLLALLLAANALIMAAIAGILLAILWNAHGSARVERWLERVRRRIAPTSVTHAPLEEAARRKLPWRGGALCLLSRTAQVAQYGVILYAVGGAPSVRGALVAHGIELVGATLGDLLPNHVGIADGAYRTFASDVGLGSAPARALSIALLARIASLTVAAVCFLVLAASRRAASAPPAAAGLATALATDDPRGSEERGALPLT